MHTFAAKRRYWKQHIAEWARSGKSGMEWAAEHGHNYKTFQYWKRRYHTPLKPDDFIELPTERPTTIHLQYQGVQIEVDAHFHAETLSKLLATIKGALC